MGSPSKTASTIVLGSGETGYDRWARSSQQIGAYYAAPKKPTTPGRAPGTAALIGRANRASAAMRVLGSTMGYDTNPPPPVAVTMPTQDPAATAPKIQVHKRGDDTLEIHYLSQRNMAAMIHGSVKGVAAYFNETASLLGSEAGEGGEQRFVFHIQPNKTQAREAV